MSRTFVLSGLALAAMMSLASAAQAQVFVRAPFVRVHVGPGVYVGAPFVRVGVPGPSFAPPGPVFVPAEPAPVVGGPVPIGEQPPLLPAPRLLPPGGLAPGAVAPMTLSEFARTFKGGRGTYETVLINPSTSQPCVVRFCLPDCPRRVTCSHDEVVFHYGFVKKVRIHFDRHGATV